MKITLFHDGRLALAAVATVLAQPGLIEQLTSNGAWHWNDVSSAFRDYLAVDPERLVQSQANLEQGQLPGFFSDPAPADHTRTLNLVTGLVP